MKNMLYPVSSIQFCAPKPAEAKKAAAKAKKEIIGGAGLHMDTSLNYSVTLSIAQREQAVKRKI
jgi:hypothetical protein